MKNNRQKIIQLIEEIPEDKLNIICQILEDVLGTMISTANKRAYRQSNRSLRDTIRANGKPLSHIVIEDREDRL